MQSKDSPIIDWQAIESSAPGKFIISGEYSVVYEKHAIAAAIDIRTRVTVKPNHNGKVRLNLKDLKGRTREWPSSSLTRFQLVSKYSECLDYDVNMPVKLSSLLHPRYYDPSEPTISEDAPTDQDNEKKAYDAAMAFLLLYIGLGDSYASGSRPAIDVEVESTIPVGAGLGSSSAYATSLCGALMRVFRVVAEKHIIGNWVFNIEKFFHGKPSGIDNNIVICGGYILFQNGKIKALGNQKYSLKVMLIDTCVSRSTRTLVENVKRLHSEDPTKINNIFNGINDLTTQIWRRISDPSFNPRSISAFLQANQSLLNLLGVGHEKLNDISRRALELDLTAKQTGAGGGGTAFILYDDCDNLENIDRLRNELTEAGYKVHDHSVGCDGLTVKMISDSQTESNVGDR